MALKEFRTTQNLDNTIAFGDAAPTSGDWKAGDRVIHTNPGANDPIEFVCVTGGAPGTWRSVYPSAVKVAYGTAAPSTGTWARGDIVWNTTPSAAGTPGWVCTAAGSPGTFKAMANLAS